MKDILELKNLSVSFDGLKVVRGVDFQIKKGEIHGILGESGSGKSVTAFSICKLHDQAVYDGSVLFDGESVLDMTESKLSTIRGYDIAYIFQNPHESFNPNRKLYKQLREAVSIHGIQPSDEKIIEVLASVGLKDPEIILKKYPDQLSGGECQRVMIGMSLLCEPKVIIADEPTSAIDASIKLQIIKLLKDINKTHGTTIVLISHDIDLVENICDSMTVMYGGLVMEQGMTSKILSEPKHPYTKALIDCTESLNKSHERLVTLEGLPLSPKYYKDHCPFYDRCKDRVAICGSEMPALKEINHRAFRCSQI
ncbi:ABC transporter ATP-binding protein [Acidaminobacter sp. JC074]|uniref:ABC transporter ATP-binding protein n=1 Tax=Acidaminobacter sp. JC074 TaxID=2530199 RepID=UPI001F0E9273|nr:ABC transporter ATP-binding protein [Acidaminobacter sp. JC074]MCH4886107.1 ABC transporter ATP-binding protein [Acidaminobacter sp. JC074]